MKKEKETDRNIHAWIREAEASKDRDDFERAIALYEKSVICLSKSDKHHGFPALPSVFIELADCYSKAGIGIDPNTVQQRWAIDEAAEPPDDLSARFIYSIAAIHYSRSEYLEAVKACNKSLAVLNKVSGSKEEIGFILHLMGQIYRQLSDFKEAKRYYEDARSLFRINGNVKKFMMATGNLGICHWRLSDWEAAKQCYEQLLVYSEDEGGGWAYLPVRINLGLAHFRLGEWKEAKRCFDEAVEYSEITGNQLRLVRSLICQGMLLSARREWRAAERRFRKAMKLSRDRGYQREVATCCEQIGWMLSEEGNYGKALDYFGRGLEVGESIAPGGDHASIYGLRAEAFLNLGKIEPALEDAQRGLAVFQGCGNRFEEGRSHRVLGRIWSEVADGEKAEEHFKAGIAIFKSIRARFDLARCLLEYARFIMAYRGSYNAGRTALKCLMDAGTVAQEITWADHLVGRIQMEIGKVRTMTGDVDFAVESYARAEELFRRSNDPVLLGEVGRLLDHIRRKIIKDNGFRFSRFQSREPLRSGSDGHILRICRSIVDEVLIDRAFLSVQTHERKFEIPFRTRNISEDEAKQLTYALLSPESKMIRRGEPIYVISPSGIDQRLAGFPETVRKRIYSLIAIPFGDRFEIDGILYMDRTLEGKGRPINGREFKQVLDRYDVLSELILRIQREKLREDERKSIDFELHGIIAEDPKFLSVLYDVQNFVRCKQILIQGESGTGKELVARLIHRNGPRRNKPFEAINCATLNENLYGSELFGHTAGAFTDAKKARKGIFEEADGGTIFLDEIDKMALSVQNGLLRAIEYGEIRRYGENRVRNVDVAVICASSRDLRGLVDEGGFLNELYYRINRPSVSLPPLRERPKDIPKLVDHFIEVINQEHGTAAKGITKRAKQLLMGYPWPGNVRDLIGVLKEASLRVEDGGEITEFGLFKVLPDLKESRMEKKKPKEVIVELEKRLIIKALLDSNWNVARAARILGWADGTLRYKIKVKHGGLEGLKSCAREEGAESRLMGIV